MCKTFSCLLVFIEVVVKIANSSLSLNFQRIKEEVWVQKITFYQTTDWGFWLIGGWTDKQFLKLLETCLKLAYWRFEHLVVSSLGAWLCFCSLGGSKSTTVFWLLWAYFDLHLSQNFEETFFIIFLSWFEFWLMVLSSKLTRLWPSTADRLPPAVLVFDMEFDCFYVPILAACDGSLIAYMSHVRFHTSNPCFLAIG